MTNDNEQTPEQEGLTSQKPEVQEEKTISTLEAEIADLKDQLLRAVAEAENIRRRAAREKQDIGKFAITGFARDLLAVPDTLTRALESINAELRALEGVAGVIEGMELTQKQLLSILERHGVKPIHPLGEKFDPNFHQAMFEAPDTGKPDGTVIQILQTGYIIEDRLLRPALVGVAKSATAASPAGGAVDTTA